MKKRKDESMTGPKGGAVETILVECRHTGNPLTICHSCVKSAIAAVRAEERGRIELIIDGFKYQFSDWRIRLVGEIRRSEVNREQRIIA